MTEESRYMRQLKAKAVEFNQQYMFKSVATKWIGYYRDNKEVIGKMIKVKAKHQNLIKSKMIANWV